MILQQYYIDDNDYDDVFEDDDCNFSGNVMYYRPQTAYLKTSPSTKSLNFLDSRIGREGGKIEKQKFKSKLDSIWVGIKSAVRNIGKNHSNLSKRLSKSMFIRRPDLALDDLSLGELSNV